MSNEKDRSRKSPRISKLQRIDVGARYFFWNWDFFRFRKLLC